MARPTAKVGDSGWLVQVAGVGETVVQPRSGVWPVYRHSLATVRIGALSAAGAAGVQALASDHADHEPMRHRVTASGLGLHCSAAMSAQLVQRTSQNTRFGMSGVQLSTFSSVSSLHCRAIGWMKSASTAEQAAAGLQALQSSS